MEHATALRRGRRRLTVLGCPVVPLVVVLLVNVLLVIVPAGRAAAGVGGVCDRADELASAGLPRQAIALLDRLEEQDADDCVARSRSAAVERLGRAEVLVGYADGRPVPDPDSGRRVQVCGAALGESPGPDDWRRAARRCDAENAAAAAPSWSEDAEERVRQGVTRHVQPWQYSVTALLAVLLVGAVVARLLQRCFPPRALGVGRDAAWALSRVGVAWSLVAVSSVLLVLVTGFVDTDPSGWLALAAAAGAWCVSVLLLAWTAARRMRLLLTVHKADGSEDDVATGHLLALLGELGSEAPRGLEAVIGTDVTALDAAGLLSAPQGKLAAAAFQLLQVFWRQAPWEVTVSVVSDHAHAVHVSRNGREVSSAIVDRYALGLGTHVVDADGKVTDRLPDLHRMTAAVVLCALQSAYGFGGLGGATSWRSVGLQSLATSDHAGTPVERRLLARAVDHDPANDAARLALWRARYRRSTDAAELQAYVRQLELYVGARGVPTAGAAAAGAAPADVPAVAAAPDVALTLRALYSVVVALVNLAFLRDPADDRAVRDDLSRARHYHEVLTPLLREVGENDQHPVRHLAGQLTDSVSMMAPTLRAAQDQDLAQEARDRGRLGLLRLLVLLAAEPSALKLALLLLLARQQSGVRPPAVEGAPLLDDPEPRSPKGHYQRACYWASRHRLRPGGARAMTDHDVGRALEHLVLADDDPDIAAWRDRDPQLADLHRRKEYRDRFPGR